MVANLQLRRLKSNSVECEERHDFLEERFVAGCVDGSNRDLSGLWTKEAGSGS
jgi:hypothetical protein